MKVCKVEGCDQSARARGWCRKHWTRWKRTGTTDLTRTGRGARLQFALDVVAGKIEPTEPGGCILFPFATSHGYGRVMVDGAEVHAGVVVLEMTLGPRPSDKHSMGHAPHDVCGNRECIAPGHLSWQTYAEQLEQQRRDGTLLAGEAHPSARFSDAEVVAAVQRVRSGESQCQVARDLGVSQSTVHRWFYGEKRGGIGKAS